VGLWVLVPACESFDDTETTQVEIQSLVKQFAEAAQKDVNAMLAMYDQGPGTTSIGNGQITRGLEAIRKSADENLVGQQGKFEIDLGSIDVVLLGGGYALSVTPFALTSTTSPLLSRRTKTIISPVMKGISTLVWKKTPQGWRVIHEHESYQPA
jgi:ketosteroid isomerase-like protein